MLGELNDFTYKVGGCVRDECLGIEPNDIDLVVESTEEKFNSIFPNAKCVGQEFKVYIIGGNEVALTRTERCIGEGYTNYDVTGIGVPIRDDLLRRDFTINSIAKHVVTGAYVDPTNGLEDIKQRIIRCTNQLAFSDDPLRIYRGARFAAKLVYKIEPITFTMMKKNVYRLKYVTTDRVYIELKKVYEQCSKPSLFFKLLKDLDALKIHFKPLHCMTKIRAGSFEYHGMNSAFDHTMEAINKCKSEGYSFDVFLAVLFHDTGKGVTKKVLEGERQKHIKHEIMSYTINKKFIEQHKFSRHQDEKIVMFARYHMVFHILQEFKNPIKLVRFFKSIKKYMIEMTYAANCDHKLTVDQIIILMRLQYVFKYTVIDVPKHLKGQGIINYVEVTYANAYKRLGDNI